ncbi:MAG: ParA family protein [Phototrophicaceae bacterium]|jgi:chromosome partitioning protein
MKTITLLNEKGGVGKTTLATHIAAGMARQGKRVVLVDTDAQGHATLAFGLSKDPGLYQIMVRNARWNDVLKGASPELYSLPEDPVGALFVLPSNIETRGIPLMIEDVTLFRNRLEELSNHIDMVIIDTAPTPSMLHASVYLATDYVIYPTKCEFWSFDGLVESLSRREKITEQKESLGMGAMQTLGIIPTMYRGNTVEHTENLKELKQRFGSLVWEPISTRTQWTEASRLMQTVWMMEPDGGAAREMNRILRRINEVVYGEQARQ